MKVFSIFNNKGGVGKTTYLFHIAHLLEKSGKVVLMADLDSQCNLSSYAMSTTELEKSWKPERGNSIWNGIERVYSGLGDIRNRKPSIVNPEYPNLYIIPGDISLSNYEDRLGDTWNSAKGGDELALRVQSAIFRYIEWCATEIKADIVLLDLGPNLGSLNRVALSGSDYFIVPMAPDLFSIRGTENLGAKLTMWRKGWDQCHSAWEESPRNSVLSIPNGAPVFLGYVVQRHNVRKNASGMTQGWEMFGEEIRPAVEKNIVAKLDAMKQILYWSDNDWNLGLIPNFHSLIPYSLKARKPVFDCTGRDGLKGAHIRRAEESSKYFAPIVQRILSVLALEDVTLANDHQINSESTQES